MRLRMTAERDRVIETLPAQAGKQCQQRPLGAEADGFDDRGAAFKGGLGTRRSDESHLRARVALPDRAQTGRRGQRAAQSGELDD